MNLDNVFKAYDIRGLVPDELNEEVARDVGRALGDFLYENVKDTRDKPVVVGRDMRGDSAGLATAVIDGLTRQGRDVIDIGQVTTDMIYFATGHLQAAGGVIVTASHNPGAYNGMKLCREGARAIGVETGLEDIKQRIKDGQFRGSIQGEVTEQDVMKEWIEHALGFASDLRPFRVAIDAGNGMAGKVIPYLEERTRLDVTPLYFELDGSFPNHDANPLKPGVLDDLAQEVIDNHLDLGLAFDGDGDRMVMMDELGEPVSGSVTCAVLARYFLEQNPGSTILYNAICSRVVPETIERCGGTPVRTKVGHSYIKAEMRKHDAPFGGEHAAHYFFRDNWSADSGLIAALVAMQILGQSGESLSELVQDYRQAYVHSGELNFEVADKEATIRRVAEAFNDGEIDWLDGLTVNYEDWWLNLRPSNTEPLLRLNVEAKSQDLLNNKLKKLKELI